MVYAYNAYNEMCRIMEMELEKRLWQHTAVAVVITAVAAGAAGTGLPQWIFYEIVRFYDQDVRPDCGFQLRECFKNMHYFAYFLCIRVLIPLLIIVTGLIKKGSFVLRFCVMAELLILAVQSVLFFGAKGMEGMFFNLKFSLLPETCYFLSVFLAFCKKKAGFCSIKQYIFTIICAALMLCCGAVIEICLF